jgi:hypothetical protein
MNRNAVPSTIIAVIALACMPVLWRFATAAIPPLSVIETQSAGNRLGPWMFTWALVWVGCLAALLVAWLAFSSGRMFSDAAPLSTKPRVDKLEQP